MSSRCLDAENPETGETVQCGDMNLYAYQQSLAENRQNARMNYGLRKMNETIECGIQERNILTTTSKRTQENGDQYYESRTQKVVAVTGF